MKELENIKAAINAEIEAMVEYSSINARHRRAELEGTATDELKSDLTDAAVAHSRSQEEVLKAISGLCKKCNFTQLSYRKLAKEGGYTL